MLRNIRRRLTDFRSQGEYGTDVYRNVDYVIYDIVNERMDVHSKKGGLVTSVPVNDVKIRKPIVVKSIISPEVIASKIGFALEFEKNITVTIEWNDKGNIAYLN